jgi:putative flippase GtrA
MVALYALHDLLKLSSLAAVAISFWIGFVAAFVMQKFIAFQNYDKNVRALSGQLAGYGVLVAWNYGFTLLMVKLFGHDVSVFIIRTIAIVIITSWNFTVYGILFNSSNKRPQ